MKCINIFLNINKWNPTKNEWLTFLSILPEPEKLKVSRYVYKKNSKQSLIGQVLIRYCIHKIIGKQELEIYRNEYGKPLAKKTTSNNLEFNISHSGNLTIISMISDVVSNGSQVGCDLMKVSVFENQVACDLEKSARDQLEKFSLIIENEFTSTERSFIHSENKNLQKLINFYRVWCLK